MKTKIKIWETDPWYRRCRQTAHRQLAVDNHTEGDQQILRAWQVDEAKKPKEPEWPRLDKPV